MGTHLQAPDWVQGDISDKFKMPKEKVIVNMTFLGGGFETKSIIWIIRRKWRWRSPNRSADLYRWYGQGKMI